MTVELNTPDLPTGKDLADVMRIHATREGLRMSTRIIRWRLAHAYLNGARRFVAQPFHSGHNGLLGSGIVAAAELSERDHKRGRLPVQMSDLIREINKVQGMLEAFNLKPHVDREGTSLTSIQNRATGQVILDSVTDTEQLNSIKRRASHIFTTYGSVGLQGHMVDHPTIGLTNDFEVIHPLELLSWPSFGIDYTRQTGVMRERLIPLERLRQRFGRRISQNVRKLETFEPMHGEALPEQDSLTFVDEMHGRRFASSNTSISDATRFTAVRVRELWITGERNTCKSYAAASGEFVITDQRFENQTVFCPIGWDSFIDTGDPHGMGMFDLLFSMVREFERFVEDLIDNTKDLNQYPVVIMPQAQLNKREVLRDDGKSLHFTFASPDPRLAAAGQSFNPITVAPPTLGDTPGRTAAFLRDIIQQTSPIRDLLREKGRVDSLPGLQFLDENDKQSVVSAARGFTNVFSSVHRWALAAATREMVASPRPVPIDRVDLGLVGAIVDFERGTVDFKQNPLPDVTRLRVGVKEVTPRSQALRKQEALAMFTAQLADADRLILLSLEEGIDLALWIEPEKAAYQVVVQNILSLYGDGQAGGSIVVTPHTERPEFQLRVLEAFMGGPEMRAASAEVQDFFIRYRTALLGFISPILPEQVPDLQESALIAQQTQGRLGQAQGALPQAV